MKLGRDTHSEVASHFAYRLCRENLLKFQRSQSFGASKNSLKTALHHKTVKVHASLWAGEIHG